MSFRCGEDGVYTFLVDIKLQATELAQVYFMLKLNDEPASVMLTSDTKGKVVRKKLRDIQLTKGEYIASFDLGSDTFFVEGVIKKYVLEIYIKYIYPIFV